MKRNQSQFDWLVNVGFQCKKEVFFSMIEMYVDHRLHMQPRATGSKSFYAFLLQVLFYVVLCSACSDLISCDYLFIYFSC